jgi:hypothetical protein
LFYKNAYLKRAPKGATLKRKWAFFSAQMSYEKVQMVRADLGQVFRCKTNPFNPVFNDNRIVHP